MATAAQSISTIPSSLSWLGEFLKHELSPYRGRTALVARMVIAATLVMMTCMVFRIPYAFQGAIYALIVSRESSQATFKSAASILSLTALAAAERLLVCFANNCCVDRLTQANVVRLAMVGTSMLRRILQRSAYVPHYAEQMGAVIALAGTLVDLAANLRSPTHLSGDDREQIRLLAENVGGVRSALLAEGTPHLNAFHVTQGNVPHAIPLVTEMQKTVQIIKEVLIGSQ